MKKFIFISVSILIFCSIISCESMDATYKDFVKDGPIMYLTRLSKDSITVRNGWERVLISDSERREIYKDCSCIESK